MKNLRNRLKISPILMGLIFLYAQVTLFTGCAPKSKQVVIWHWMADRKDAFRSLSDKYFDETGVRAKFVLCAPSERYAKKIRFAAVTSRLPDIYGMLGGVWEFSNFINSGYALDLSDELNTNGGEWREQFLGGVISENEFLPGNEQRVKPGIYGISIDVNNIQMVYNKDLFKAAGLDPEAPPKTWKEFIEYGKRLKQAGIPAFVSGWRELWLIDCFTSNYALNLMGEKKVLQTMKGFISYTAPEWLRVLKLFEEMRDAGILAEDITALDNKKAEKIFANSQAAMAFNGSWCVNVYREMNPGLNYAVFLPPKLSSNYPMKIWGGVGAPFVVNAKSKNKKEAIDFLKWLTAEKQQTYLARFTYNLPVNKYAIFYAPSKLKDFADDMDSVVHPKLLFGYEKSNVTEELDKGVQDIIRGQRTPAEVARYVDTIKLILDRYRGFER
ncbi:MAG: hypothetical protein AMJ78_09830 [Omnitrophica WOR_2 bacterium SM23_29]|nr:MAG: hypothetical protein AMJ78_09830 [Omnitrophica WOR_2 bacterium SM23_29]